MEMHESNLKDFASDLGLARLTDSTIATYVRHCERWAEQAEGAFTIRSAKSWLSTLTPWAAYMGGRSIRSYVKWYSGEYKVEDWSAEVPCVEPRDCPPQRVASENDFTALLACCENDKRRVRGLRDAALLTLLRTTGLRRGEVSRMQWNDIDNSTGVLAIPKTKTKKARTVPLNRETRRSLRQYANGLDETRTPPDPGV
jgi:integrase